MSHDPSPANGGLAHGFDFTGNLPLIGLRTGSAPVVAVNSTPVTYSGGVKVGEWEEIPGKRAHVTVVEMEPGRYLVTVGSMGRFVVDTSRRQIDAEFREDLPPIVRTTTLMSTPAALFISDAGKAALHAGAVDVGGRALLLSAEGSGGKTTLTAAFHIAGHRILSEDLSAVDPTGFVDPAPALLRLRPETAARIGSSLAAATELWEEPSGRQFYEISPERRGGGEPVPLAAVVMLGWSDRETSIEPVPPALAVQELWRKAFYLAKETGPSKCFDQLATLVGSTPVYRLLRPRDFGILESTVARLVDEVIDSEGAP